jgi:ribosome biogenesis GTPase A
MLAASHAIGSNALIEEEVATFLADAILARYPQLITARYGLQSEPGAVLDGVGVIEGVARRRGFLLKGGGVDLEKAAHTLLQDYRTGTLGRISLETPETRAVALAAHAEEMARLAAVKAAKDAAAAEEAARRSRG